MARENIISPTNFIIGEISSTISLKGQVPTQILKKKVNMRGSSRKIYTMEEEFSKRKIISTLDSGAEGLRKARAKRLSPTRPDTRDSLRTISATARDS